MSEHSDLPAKAISFNNPMVLAIQAGQKTQTRRPVIEGRKVPWKIGDRLWVRESARTIRIWIGPTTKNRYVQLQYTSDNHFFLDFEIPSRLKPLIEGNCIPNGCFREAARIFLEVEPLLAAVDFRWTPYAHEAAGQTYNEYLDEHGSVNEYETLRKIDWVIVGGESGPGARPMHPDWARGIRYQCVAAGVAYFHKQNGEWGLEDGLFSAISTPRIPVRMIAFDHNDRGEGSVKMARIGKKSSVRLLDGREWNQMPGDLL